MKESINFTIKEFNKRLKLQRIQMYLVKYFTIKEFNKRLKPLEAIMLRGGNFTIKEFNKRLKRNRLPYQQSYQFYHKRI